MINPKNFFHLGEKIGIFTDIIVVDLNTEIIYWEVIFMKRAWILLTVIFLMGIIVLPAQAVGSITVNPFAILNDYYIVDYEHTINGDGSINLGSGTYNSATDGTIGRTLSLGFKQYFESDAQGGRYLGLSGTYYDVEQGHDIWGVDAGHAVAITLDYGYRYIADSGFTLEFGLSGGMYKQDDENHLILTARAQAGFGW